MDRLVRLWNPYVTSKPIGRLRGHSAPICYLCIVGNEKRLYSVSTDRCIKVHCINVLSSHTHKNTNVMLNNSQPPTDYYASPSAAVEIKTAKLWHIIYSVLTYLLIAVMQPQPSHWRLEPNVTIFVFMRCNMNTTSAILPYYGEWRWLLHFLFIVYQPYFVFRGNSILLPSQLVRYIYLVRCCFNTTFNGCWLNKFIQNCADV